MEINTMLLLLLSGASNKEVTRVLIDALVIPLLLTLIVCVGIYTVYKKTISPFIKQKDKMVEYRGQEISIEQERLKIEQKRLELRQKEVEENQAKIATGLTNN